MTITNKFAGTCTECSTRVASGKGTATKVGNKWVVRCAAHKGETHGATNPWRDQHMQAEMDYTGGEYTRSKARARVNGEYRNTDDMSEPCECGGTCYYRATVGARQCPDCGAIIVYRWDEANKKTIRSIVK